MVSKVQSKEMLPGLDGFGSKYVFRSKDTGYRAFPQRKNFFASLGRFDGYLFGLLDNGHGLEMLIDTPLHCCRLSQRAKEVYPSPVDGNDTSTIGG